MRGIHKEYNLLRGRQIKIEFLRENFFDPNKCQCLLISGANRYQQCSRKPNKDTTDGIL